MFSDFVVLAAAATRDRHRLNPNQHLRSIAKRNLASSSLRLDPSSAHCGRSYFRGKATAVCPIHRAARAAVCDDVPASPSPGSFATRHRPLAEARGGFELSWLQLAVARARPLTLDGKPRGMLSPALFFGRRGGSLCEATAILSPARPYRTRDGERLVIDVE